MCVANSERQDLFALRQASIGSRTKRWRNHKTGGTRRRPTAAGDALPQTHRLVVKRGPRLEMTDALVQTVHVGSWHRRANSRSLDQNVFARHGVSFFLSYHHNVAFSFFSKRVGKSWKNVYQNVFFSESKPKEATTKVRRRRRASDRRWNG